MKLTLLSLLIGIGFASYADIPMPEQPGCAQFKIKGEAEVTKMMNMIPGKGKIESAGDGETKIVTKEINLGNGTVISCTSLTDNRGKPVGYHRGQRPTCTIYAPPSGAGAPSGGAEKAN